MQEAHVSRFKALILITLAITFIPTLGLRAKAESIADYPKYNAYAQEKASFLHTTQDPTQYETVEDYAAYVQREVPKVVDALDGASAELISTQYSADASMAADLIIVRSALVGYADAAKTSDMTKIDDAGKVLNSALELENRTITSLQQQNAVTPKPISKDTMFIVYLLIFIASLTVSVYIYYWSRRSPQVPVKNSNNSEEAFMLAKTQKQQVFKSSLLPVGGAFITLAWYVYVYLNGGMYFILWGPVLIGWILLYGNYRRYKIDETAGRHESIAETSKKISRTTAPASFDIYENHGRIRRMNKSVHAVLTIDHKSGTLLFTYDDQSVMKVPKKDLQTNLTINNILTIGGKMGVGYWITTSPSKPKGVIFKKMKPSPSELKTLREIEIALLLFLPKPKFII